MNHQPRKRFGQNFLQSQQIIEQILTALNLHVDDKVIEIGPGMGALTRPILKRLNHLTAIEIDRDLKNFLIETVAKEGSLDILGEDALAVDYKQWGKGLRIVGNLPYNISTPLMLHLLSFTDNIEDMHFMLQKEMVDRLVGQPGTRDYGRLSIMMQYHCDAEYLFDVPPESFHPQPKVNSAIVRLTPFQESPYPKVDVTALQNLVAKAFAMRRKTLANNLKGVINAKELADLEIDPGLRPEQIGILDFVRLTNSIHKQKDL